MIQDDISNTPNMGIQARPLGEFVELLVGPFQGGIGLNPYTARRLAVQLLNSADDAEEVEIDRTEQDPAAGLVRSAAAPALGL